MFLFWEKYFNVNYYDIGLIALISLIISIIVSIIYNRKRDKKTIYMDFINTNNIFYNKGKNGYIDKDKVFGENTKYVECHFLLSFYNNTNRSFICHSINVVSIKHGKIKKLEEGSININGTEKSVAGVSTYDKLQKIKILPYDGENYDVNIRLSKEEYLNIKHVYLSYRGKKNKINRIKIKLQKKL